MLWPAYYNQSIDLLVRNYQAVCFGQMPIEALRATTTSLGTV